jgi:nucleoid-associated protein YgaU
MPLLAASDARRGSPPATKPERGAKTPEDSRPLGGSGGERTHVVAKGEALQSIAKQVYGRSSEWEKIWQANRDRLSRPEALQTGMTLRIP